MYFQKEKDGCTENWKLIDFDSACIVDRDNQSLYYTGRSETANIVNNVEYDDVKSRLYRQVGTGIMSSKIDNLQSR
ncbi:hypothetical protein RhiirB3_430718 [Rhizophagus irregularis]|nr:hypothetical protein RhiirB3_430718 [Rhizophagus irregularis]